MLRFQIGLQLWKIPIIFQRSGRTTSLLLNVHNVSDVGQTDTYTAGLLILDPRTFKVETAIAKLKRYKSPGSDKIMAELVPAGGETFLSEIHKIVKSVWNKKELHYQ
jgi:hypothetical protein